MPSRLPSTDARAEGIDYFGRGHWLTGVQERVSVGARRRMFELWSSYAGEIRGRSILDVGTTPDRERQDSNCMLPWFIDAGMHLSLYSPENISSLKSLFPGASFLPSVSADEPLPAQDRSYDWVCSSAVLEHVGSADRQIGHIRDCARVGNGLFLTTPNRYHWLEFHTKLPLIHWLPRSLHRSLLRRLGKELWAQESHLRLLDRRELLGMARQAIGDRFAFSVLRVWTLGMPSNLILLARRLS